jgi:hypothetical protein
VCSFGLEHDKNVALLVYQTQVSGFDSMIFGWFNFLGWLTGGVRPDRGDSGSPVKDTN